MNTTTICKMLCLAVLMAGLSCTKEAPVVDDGTQKPEEPSTGAVIPIEMTSSGIQPESRSVGLHIPSCKEFNRELKFADGKFKGEINIPKAGEKIYAYYPYTPLAADGFFTFTMPSETDGKTLHNVKVAEPAIIPEFADMLSVSMTFNDILGTLSINVTDVTQNSSLSGEKINSIRLSCDKDIAGIVKVGIMDGSVTLGEGSKTVEILPSEDLFLGNGPVTFSISLPAGTYTGSAVVNTAVSSHEFPIELTVTSGKETSLSLECKEVEYKGIGSAEEWNSFIKALASGSYTGFVNPETGEVELCDNIYSDDTFEYPGSQASDEVEFNGRLNGKGYKITCSSFTRPLFNTLGKDAIVKDLVVEGTFTGFLNPGLCGNAVIAKTNKGLIENVETRVDCNLTVETGVVFGAICGQNGGTLKNCRNYGDVTIHQAAKSSAGFYGGGLCAIGHTVTSEVVPTALNVDDTCSPGKFVSCENHGNIEAIADGAKPIRSGFGGICGVVYMNGVVFSDCRNFGDVSRITGDEASNNGSASVGGILGRSAGWYVTGTGDSAAMDNGSSNGFDTVYENCSNSGQILCKCRHSGGVSPTGSGARHDNVGGIVGAAIGKDGSVQKLKGCVNTGSVKGGWNTVNTTVIGGLAGMAVKTDIEDCIADCRLESIDNSYSVGAAGGLVGFVLADVSVKGTTVAKPVIDIYTVSGKKLYYGLLFGLVQTSASADGVSLSGSIAIDGQDTSVNSDNFMSALYSESSAVQPVVENIFWSNE